MRMSSNNCFSWKRFLFSILRTTKHLKKIIIYTGIKVTAEFSSRMLSKKLVYIKKEYVEATK